MYENRMWFESVEADLPFQFNLIGHSYCDGSYQIARRNFPFYIFEYIMEGRGSLRVEDQHFIPEKGDVYIIPPATDHEYHSSSEHPWTKVFFNAGGPILRQMLESYDLSGSILFRKMPQSVLDLFEDGVQSIAQSPADALKLGPVYLLRIIMEISEHYKKQCCNYSDTAIAIRHFLDDHVYKPGISLQEIAEQIHYSPSQIIRIFQKDFHMTPYAYLLNRKIEIAQVILRNSSIPIKKVSFQLGFSDVYYFSNLFKKKTGVSPLHFRRQNTDVGNVFEPEKFSGMELHTVV